ncbi:hypothetical protein MRY87_09480 [bacterium]|nr:hypothetical protein [bacterium]
MVDITSSSSHDFSGSIVNELTAERESLIVEDAVELMRIPSHSQISKDGIVEAAREIILKRLDIVPEVLIHDGQASGLLVEIEGSKERGPHYCLNACIDTAAVGECESWETDPHSPVMKDGYLIGRGAADSKVAGPSNVGNFLALHGVSAVCGFGLKADGIHGANERIRIDSISPTYMAYGQALEALFSKFRS